MATVADLIRRVESAGEDISQMFQVTNALTAVAADDTLTLPADQGANLSAQTVLESDDWEANDAVEQVFCPTGAVNDAFLSVRRGFHSTVLAHAANTWWNMKPRWGKNRIWDALQGIATSELWPQVWITVRQNVTWSAATELYSLFDEWDEVSYAFQKFNGLRFGVHVEHMPAGFSSDAGYAQGALVIRNVADTGSPVYVVGKQNPKRVVLVDADIPDEIAHLLVLGAHARLQITEETRTAAPDIGAISGKVGPTVRARAGAFLWQQFTSARDQESLRLHAELIASANQGFRGIEW